MTYFYSLSSSMGQPQQPQITEETITMWKHLSEKKHWRIVQLPNGYFQTEHRDLQDDHYGKKVDFLKGPKVVKTFK